MYICHYYHFLEINFWFQPNVCDDLTYCFDLTYCLDLAQKVLSFNDVAIVSVTRNNYRIHFLYTSRDEVISSSINADLTEKSGRL